MRSEQADKLWIHVMLPPGERGPLQRVLSGFSRDSLKRSSFSSYFPLLLICSLLLFIVGCAAPTGAAAKQPTNAPVSVTATTAASYLSTASFTFSGGQNASYTLHTSTPTSQLRHGHREFTIILKDAGVSLFIAFYGYEGPGRYTLKDAANGGDVHIGLASDTISWDLLMRPGDSCDLLVASDTPTSIAGLDRMRGTFTCPLLLSSSPNKPQQPVQVNQGTFDLAMLVTS